METVVVGAGPCGLFTAIALARRGRKVVVVDRDPGPPPAGDPAAWRRHGVMQFHHSHTFRRQVIDALAEMMPEVIVDLTTAGAGIAVGPDGRPVALLCRRTTFDRALWQAARREPGVVLLTGHVDALIVDAGRAAGVVVEGRRMAADVVIDASGRAARFTAAVRPPGEREDCRAVYVSRHYRTRPGATPAPTNSPIGLSLSCAGYLAVAFLHDNRTFSINFVHDGTDARLRGLRHDDAFDAAAQAIPLLSDWVDPARAQPISAALPGGRLVNSYRGQLDEAGRPAMPHLISVGDAVCTTTPLAGRGTAMALQQAVELVRTLDRCGHDFDRAAIEFDQWCTRNVRPWFDDHKHCDADRVRRWAGGDVDLEQPLPSDLVVAAAEALPELTEVVAPYVTMDALPASLAPAREAAGRLYAGGWRPRLAAAPTREELSAVVAASTPRAVA